MNYLFMKKLILLAFEEWVPMSSLDLMLFQLLGLSLLDMCSLKDSELQCVHLITMLLDQVTRSF